MILNGPDPERDRVRRWRVVDLRRVVEERFGVVYSESGMHALLKRLGIAWMSARPSHPRSDAKAQEAFKENFPALLTEIARSVGPGKALELWFTDESRVDQKGRLTRIWHAKGHRPRGLRDHRFRSAWIFGAVCPERDTGEALVCTHIGTASMNAFLAELAKAIPEGRHAVVLMDKAGWHLSGKLTVPANMTLVPLPAYFPELNPIERFWQHLKDRWPSNRIFETLDDVVDACCDAWNAALAEPGTITSVSACSWAKV